MAAGLALAAFFVAGAMIVPFHGDESIWLYMSHDFDDLFVRRDVSRLLYSENPIDPEDQSLRELNNPLAKYVISLSWRAAGYADADLNGYWVWGAGWEWNAENGRIPSDGLLRASRWLPAGLAALGVLAVAAFGVRLGGWWVGGLAALLLATDASFLLHTRRAMGEGTLLAFSMMTIALTVAYLSRRASGETLTVRTRAAYLLGIGLLTGLTVATKLNGAIVAAAVGLALLFWLPWRIGPRDALTTAGLDGAVVAGLALVVVMTLSPFLWLNPLARLRDTFRDMNDVIAIQRIGHDSLETPGERAGALVEQVFWTQTAYYEDAIWGEWVGDQIARYEASPLSGWRRPPWARVALAAAFVVGVGWLLARRSDDPAHNVMRVVVLLWLAVTALVTLLIIPFAWQRYYLPLWPGVALVEAVGLIAIVNGLRHGWPAVNQDRST
jgi:4-amino-4-deoxy-L-arabinose transferase-like glycosyltransferase